MKDYIVRATAADHAVRAFAITSKHLTETARLCHHTSPVVSAALGRLLAAGAMMGIMMKGKDDLLTIQVICDGPLKGMTVTADSAGHVKGYPNVANVELPPNKLGKLDVGGAVGSGILRVIQDMGLKEPYVGTTQLQTGEIAEDLTYYFASSQQVPSSVGLGVLVDTDCSIRQAGGFIVQLMPHASEEVIGQLEYNIQHISSVTDMLEQGAAPEDILGNVLAGMDLEITCKEGEGNQEYRTGASFQCNCSKERVTKALLSISKKDLQDIVNDNEPIEIKCQFCNKAYTFDVDELKDML